MADHFQVFVQLQVGLDALPENLVVVNNDDGDLSAALGCSLAHAGLERRKDMPVLP
jgi:hypothetical protein